MEELYYSSMSFIWDPKFLLPGNITWADLENIDGGIYHAQLSDISTSLLLVPFLYALRFITERYIFQPIGLQHGLRDTNTRMAPPNKILETVYKYEKKKKLSAYEMLTLAKKTCTTERYVDNWFRLRRNQDRSTPLTKFTETGWRFTVYFFLFWYGLIVLWDKDFFWDGIKCWIGFPHQHISNGIYWYYMIELGCYWSFTLSQFKDVKRKDFVEMFLHHVATLMLLVLSWVGNMVRMGSVVLIIHDTADWMMESAKLAKYANYGNLCDVLFVFFMVTWIITRLVLFPYKILLLSLFDVHTLLEYGPWPYYTMNGCLVTLQLLHIFWSYYIIKMASTALREKAVQGDSRSSDEELSSEEDFSSRTCLGPG